MHIKNISHLQHCGGHCLLKIKRRLCLERRTFKNGVLNVNDARKKKMPCNEVKKEDHQINFLKVPMLYLIIIKCHNINI